MSKRSLVVLALALLALTVSANAATIVYTVVPGDLTTGLSGTNRYGVYAKVVDGAGLAGFEVVLNPAAFTTLSPYSPVAALRDTIGHEDPDSGEIVKNADLAVGFDQYRSASGVADIKGGQNPNNPNSTIFGVGVSSGTFSSLVVPGYDSVTGATPATGAWTQTQYGVLIARGTMNTATPVAATVAGWFGTAAQPAPGNAYLVAGNAGSAAAFTGATYQVVPEPATMTLLGLGALGMFIRRRRAA